MKKFQQGGVYDVNPQVPNVGQISGVPALTLPAVGAVPVADILALNRDLETRRRQEEARLVREQSLLEKEKQLYFDLRDDVFGDYQNENQKKRFEIIKKKYGISDDIKFDLNNTFHVKSETDKLRRASQDQDLREVFKEVESAKKLRDIGNAFNFKSIEDRERWMAAMEEFRNYSADPLPGKSNGYDTMKLVPDLYDTPVAPKETNYATQLRLNSKEWDTLDLSNEQDMRIFENKAANIFLGAGEKEAVDRGFITVDEFGIPTLADKGKQFAEVFAQTAQIDYQRRRENQLRDSAERKAQPTSAQLRDSEKRSGSTPNEDRFPNLTGAASLEIAGTIYDQVRRAVPQIPPDDPDMILEIENIVKNVSLPERQKAISALIKALEGRKVLTDDEFAAEKIRQLNAGEITQAQYLKAIQDRFRGQAPAPQSTPQVTPQATPQVVPQPTGQKKYNPITKRFE